SAIIQVQTPSTNPAHIIANAVAPNSCWGQVAAPAAPGIPNAHLGIAGRIDLFPDFLTYNSSIPPVVEGAIFYVPDFSRRVRVSLTGADSIVPFNSDLAASVTFWDERGTVVGGFRQGRILNAGAIVGSNAPEVQPIPYNAVLMSVTGDPAILDALAFVHWRISPYRREGSERHRRAILHGQKRSDLEAHHCRERCGRDARSRLAAEVQRCAGPWPDQRAEGGPARRCADRRDQESGRGVRGPARQGSG